MRWCLNTSYGIRIWRCGDAGVVYHPGSGDTHHLSLLAVIVLETVQSIPQSSSELAEKIAVKMGDDLDDELLAAVNSALHDVERLGLIESLE